MDDDAEQFLPVPLPAAVALPACANCGTPGIGRYCSQCGQRLDIHVHSVGHFIGEAAEVMTHADSRVWGTLLPLLTRPGFLTREYFAGRRVRYLQAFRLYVITSVLFFVLVALLSGGQGQTTVLQPNRPDAQRSCGGIHSDLPAHKWFEAHFTVACHNIVADNGHAFTERVAHNFGRAMFVFLPLLAGLMKLLYWRPRRYYLEHLLLLIHNHAFVFLLLSIFMLATHWVTTDGWLAVISLATVWYLGRYLYRSMKTAYGQSGKLTFLKFNVLAAAYLVCGMFMLVVTAVFSAVTLR
jgi:hypothetical protein